MTRIHFEGIVSPWLGALLAILGAVAIWFWYRRETRSLARPWPIVLPLLRAVAVALMVVMLTGPILSRQWFSGSLAPLAVLIDESASMRMQDPNKSLHRSVRVASWLEGDGERSGWLAEVRSRFHVKVFGFGNRLQADGLRTVWDSALHPSGSPVRLSLKSDDNRSAVGDALDGIASVANRPAAVVLVSDGQSNSGMAIASVADRLRDREIPVFALGLGRVDEPDDIAILAVDHPKSIIATELFQGTATIKQRIPAGTPYRLSILKGGRTLHTESLIADGASTRTLDYRVSGTSLCDGILENASLGSRSVPVDLVFQLETDSEDAVSSNNSLESSLWGVTKRDRILILDPRGRWEFRYIKNAFQRDSAWEVDAILGPQEFESRQFPANREDLLPWDVLIVSLENGSAWNLLQKRWVGERIAESGMGFIWIDSGRPRPLDGTPLALDWSPVDFDAQSNSASIRRLELSSIAWNERAFAFEGDEQSNAKLWSSLPAPRVARRVAQRPGTEILVAGRTESDTLLPMIVSRNYGQGKVVYIANDESWRWRYNVADLYHQRFWSQIAQWTMQTPYTMENDFAAFDVGERTYQAGARIPIRALLKNADRSPLVNARAYAVIHREGVRVDSIPLSEYPSGSGMYAGSSPPMPEGKYTLSLEVPGVPAENVPWQSDVRIHEGSNLELQALSQNVEALKLVADRTGGAYLDETEFDQLTGLLKPRQSGTLEQSRWALWQSYPWFIAAVALLSVEWFLRKRAGLV